MIFESHAVGGRFRTGPWVLALAMVLLALAAPAAMGRNVYVANSNGESVSVIDTASGAVVGEPIDVGVHPRGVAISPDGTRAYVSGWAPPPSP